MNKQDFDFSDDELSALSEEEKQALATEIEDEADEADEQVQNADSEDQAQEEPVAAQAEESSQKTLVDTYIELNAKIEKLGADMEDGEIGFSEYNKQLNELISQKTRLEILYEQQQQAEAAAENEWTNAQNKFFSDPANAAIMQNEKHYKWLSDEVTEISNSPEAKGKSYEWILQQAKDQLIANGIQLSSSTKPKRAIDTVTLPVVLGNIPAAQANDAENEFAHLNRLSPTRLEAALAKMKPEEMNRYMEQG